MWFKFPKGFRRIAVERQEFVVEATDVEGCGYFRAPEHFAPKILAIGGFSVANEVPEGAPADLARADPLRDGAITQLTAGQEALKREVQNLRSDLAAANSKLRAAENEKAELALQLHEARVKLIAFEEEDEEKAEATSRHGFRPLTEGYQPTANGGAVQKPPPTGGSSAMPPQAAAPLTLQAVSGGKHK